MNIFKRELKAGWKGLLIWCVIMFIFIVAGMSKYTMYSTGGQMNILLKDMPKSIKALMGAGTFDVTTMTGFYVFLFSFIEIMVAIHAALLGAGIISKEERDKTTEFLMVKPVSRVSVITSKLFAALFNIIVINIVTFISSIVLVAAYNKGKDISGEIALLMLSMFIVQLIFLSLGMAIAAFMKNPKSSGTVATAVVLVGYIISKITDLTDKLNFLNLFSPFKYFNLYDLAIKNEMNIAILLLTLLLAVIFFASTYVLYKRRDLMV